MKLLRFILLFVFSAGLHEANAASQETRKLNVF